MINFGWRHFNFDSAAFITKVCFHGLRTPREETALWFMPSAHLHCESNSQIIQYLCVFLVTFFTKVRKPRAALFLPTSNNTSRILNQKKNQLSTEGLVKCNFYTYKYVFKRLQVYFQCWSSFRFHLFLAKCCSTFWLDALLAEENCPKGLPWILHIQVFPSDLGKHFLYLLSRTYELENCY